MTLTVNNTIRGVIQRRLLQSPEAKAHHVDPSSSSKSLPRWAIYTIAIGGALVFVVIAAATVYLLFSRRKKDTTVMPWSTGLSGPLSKAFVAGQSLTTRTLWVKPNGHNSSD
jgi:hypothetical protein